MSAQPARHLRVVDETGQVLDEHPEIADLQGVVKGLESDVRKWITKYNDLLRDKEAEAQASQHWPLAVIIFKTWRKATGHKRSGFTADRFFLIEPFLKKSKVYGPTMCLRSVAGIAYDHYSSTRRNGSIQHFDEWERCFRDAGQIERFANAAPSGWREDPVFVDALEQIAVRQR